MENDKRLVLCVANAYEEQYYFNEVFDKIPQSIKDEIRIIAVLFTNEVGGIFSIQFEEDGTLVIETNCDEDDILYDEISSGLLVREIKNKRQDLLESLTMFYNVFVLGKNEFLTEEGES